MSPPIPSSATPGELSRWLRKSLTGSAIMALARAFEAPPPAATSTPISSASERTVPASPPAARAMRRDPMTAMVLPMNLPPHRTREVLTNPALIKSVAPSASPAARSPETPTSPPAPTAKAPTPPPIPPAATTPSPAKSAPAKPVGKTGISNNDECRMQSAECRIQSVEFQNPNPRIPNQFRSSKLE